MSPALAGALAALGGLLAAACLGCILYLSGKGTPKREAAILAQTGISAFQVIGGAGCALVFAALWENELLACALGETESPDLVVVLWSTLLALLGLGVLWMALVRRVWCTATALVQRTWRGEIITAPWRELKGAVAAVSFDDVTIPWGDRKLVLDASMTDFAEVAGCLRRQGIDLSALPKKRPSFFARGKKDDSDPLSGRR